MQKIFKIITNHQNNLIPLPTRAGRRWHIVWQGPRLGFVAETGNYVTSHALCTIFLPYLCLACHFSHFVLPYPGMCRSSSCSFVCAAAVICFYSHQVRSNMKTTTTNINNNICSQVRHAYVTKGYIRIHIFIRMMQVNLVPLHTIYTGTYIVCGTSWYQPVIPVPGGTSPW